MTIKKKMASVAVGLGMITGLAVSAILVVPAGSASAQGATHVFDQVGVNALASCSTHRIESVAANLAIRYEPDISSSAITVAQRGYRYDCARFEPTGYILGGRYTACGVTNGNGWIGVVFYTPTGFYLGFTYQACVKDV